MALLRAGSASSFLTDFFTLSVLSLTKYQRVRHFFRKSAQRKHEGEAFVELYFLLW